MRLFSILQLAILAGLLASVCGCNMTNIPDPKKKLASDGSAGAGEETNSQATPPAEANPLNPAQETNTPPLSTVQENSNNPNRSIIVNRPFMTLTANETTVPAEIVGHLEEIDSALQDLLLAGQTNVIEKELFQQSLTRLTELKLKAAERLANTSTAEADQQKAGALAQLEALSHKSGMLQDVDAARQLEELATKLEASPDADLQHQGRVVLLGFELQSLENGISKSPEKLLERTRELFQGGGEKNFPGFMMLQRIVQACQQLGFADAAQEAQQLIATEYQDSADPLLRGEAWKFAVRDSQALQNFNVALSTLGTPQFDSSAAIAAARGLYEAFPTEATLEQLSALIGNLEYGGQQLVSTQLAEFVTSNLSEEDSPAKRNAAKFVNEHRARTGLVGTKLDLSTLVGFDGKPFDPSAYEGKVVLIDFWASWCVPCMQEVPNLLAAHTQLSGEGFDIIGVNMDEDLNQATQVINSKSYPWTNYRFSDAIGFDSEFAKQNGINMIPFMVMIGKDGIVKKLHIRGVDIVPTLREELGLSSEIIPPELELNN